MEQGQAQVVDNLGLFDQQGSLFGRRLLALDLCQVLVLMLQGFVEVEYRQVRLGQHQMEATQVILVAGPESGSDLVGGLLLQG